MAALLEVRAMRKKFGSLQALDGVDLDVHQGTFHGLIGPNSSGRRPATSNAAQPPWQLPMTHGLPSARGCSAMTFSRNIASVWMTSSIVWPGIGSGVKPMRYAGWPAFIATPSSLSALKPPIPGPV